MGVTGGQASPANPPEPERKEPEITAAICTRNRPDVLRRALASLEAQRPAVREIVVVDNAPSSEAARLLVEREHPRVRYIREAVPGLDVARNRALREARSSVVAFLDDDAVAEPDWAAAIVRTFARGPAVALCMGRVGPLTLATPGARLFEANGGFARGNEPLRVGRDLPRRGRPLIAWSISIGSGCSMAIDRDIALRLGGFDDALDMGEALPGGGDLDIIWRVLEAGYHVVYEPSVRAFHEHRPTEAAVVHQIAEHNRSLIAVLVKSARRAGWGDRIPILTFLGWRLMKPGVRLGFRVVGRDPLPVPALLTLWGACWRGLGSYRRAVQEADRRRMSAEATPL
jgi:O-antigen biosynthesis protein